jgi:hypothetical protein
MIHLAETTPGTNQASGYGDLTSTESIWYVICPVFRTSGAQLPEGSGFSSHEMTQTMLLSLFGLTEVYVHCN